MNKSFVFLFILLENSQKQVMSSTVSVIIFQEKLE